MVFWLLPNGRQRQEMIRHVKQMLYHTHCQDTDRALGLLHKSVPSYTPAGVPSRG